MEVHEYSTLLLYDGAGEVCGEILVSQISSLVMLGENEGVMIVLKNSGEILKSYCPMADVSEAWKEWRNMMCNLIDTF